MSSKAVRSVVFGEMVFLWGWRWGQDSYRLQMAFQFPIYAAIPKSNDRDVIIAKG